MIRFGFFLIFVGLMVMFIMIMDRYEFSTEKIKGKCFFFIKEVLFDNIPDV